MATTEKGIYYPNDGTKVADILTDMKKMAGSIDEVIGENEFDPSQINQSITHLQQNVTVLQESQTAQDNEINQIKGTLTNKETEIAKNIHIEDAEGFGKLSILGNHEQNGEPSEENPVEIKCLGDNKKNLFSLDNKLENAQIDYFDETIENSSDYDTYYIELEEGQSFVLSLKFSNDYYKTAISSWGYLSEIPVLGASFDWDKIGRSSLGEINNKAFTAKRKYFVISILREILPYIYDIQVEKGTVATSFVPYGQGSTEIKIENSDKTQDLTYVLPIQQEMLKGDYFLKELDIWKEVHNWQKIDSYNGESITTDYISTTGSLTTGATVFYKLQTPKKIPCTEEQSKILNQLNALDLFEGVNDITTTENIALLQLKYVSNVNEVDILKEEIEDLKDNQIHIETEQSSTINVQDCSNLSAKIDIFGVSKQETRSGINLTNYKEWVGLSTKEQITKKDDDEIICTITDSSYGVRDIERILKPNTNYTACVDSKFSGNLGSQYGLRVNINGSTTSLKADGLVNFTTDETGKAEMRYYVGFPYSGENATLTVSNIRLYEGTYTKENIPDYEQYGASPSPQYPSEIENVVGDIDITICNKNLFNKDTAKQNFILSATGAELESEGAFISDYILVKKGINYFSNTRGYANAGFYNLNKEFIERKDLSQNALFSPDNDYYIRLNGKIENINTFQFEIGTTSISYVEHEEQIITFPLKEGQKMYEGSKTEDDGIHHIIKQIELDGTENVILFEWTTPHNKTTMFKILKIIAKKTDAIKFCNYFKRVKNTAENLDKDEEYCLSDMGGAIAFSISNDIATTVEQFKTWLAQKKQEEKPVLVEYQLLEEEVEPYTEAQQEAYNQLQNVTPYKLVTNISTDKAELVFKYIADTKTYVDNEINSIKEQLKTVNELLSTTKTSAMLLDNMQTDLESEVL